MLGSHPIKVWAKSQGAVALSSMEAELYAAVLGAVEMYGIANILQDLGQSVDRHLVIDSSAALGLMRREGLGKAKHVELHWLWIQQEHRQRRLQLSKIAGEWNPADLGTKLVPGPILRRHMQTLGCEFVDI